MHQPYVLIHQARPSHQILLHQALNAQGVFDVRISANTTHLNACLGAERRPDLLILDHAMPTQAGLALLAQQHRARDAGDGVFHPRRQERHDAAAGHHQRHGLVVVIDLRAGEQLPVRLRLADGKLYPEKGKVDFIDVAVDPNTDGQMARAVFDSGVPQFGVCYGIQLATVAAHYQT